MGLKNVNYYLSEIRAREVVFDERELLNFVFEKSYEYHSKMDKDTKTTIDSLMKGQLKNILKKADEIHNYDDIREPYNITGMIKFRAEERLKNSL